MAFAMYRHWLVTRPYLTSAVTSGAVLAAGDALAQSIEHRRYLTAHPTATSLTNAALSFQPNRTFILSLWGGAVFSPFFTRFFHFLDAKPYLKAKTPRNIAIRVFAIFAVAQPLNAFFFVYTSTLEYFLPVDRLGAAHVDVAVAGPAHTQQLIEASTGGHPQTLRQSLPPSSSSPSLSASHFHHSFDLHATHRLPSFPSAPPPSLPPPSSFFFSADSPSPPSPPSSFAVAYRAISQRATAQLVEKMPIVAVNAAVVWMPFNVINQSIVPLQWRVVTGSVVSVFWNCWMSLTAHEEVKGK